MIYIIIQLKNPNYISENPSILKELSNVFGVAIRIPLQKGSMVDNFSNSRYIT